MGSSEIQRFRRLLSIGSDSIAYKVSEKKLDIARTRVVKALITEGKSDEVINEIVSANTERRSIRREVLFQSLAICAKSDNETLKKKAHDAVVEICSTPAELFLFLNASKTLTDSTKGWGRSQRTAVSRWYNTRTSKELVELVTRFKSRAGWSHRDVFRLAHLKADSDDVAVIFKYVVKGLEAAKSEFAENTAEDVQSVLKYLEAVEIVKHSEDHHQIAMLIEQFKFYKEHIPTPAHNSTEVWGALIKDMTITEVLQNVGKLASIGFLSESTPTVSFFLEKVTNESDIKEQKVQPFVVFHASQIYEQVPVKGKKKWTKNPAVTEALRKTFKTALEYYPPTEKRFLIAIKVGTPTLRPAKHTNVLTPVLVSSALSYIINWKEEHCQLGSIGTKLVPLVIPKAASLEKYHEEITKGVIPNPYKLHCPITWAGDNDRKVDVFIILTDVPISQREFRDDPSLKEALEQYRSRMNMPKAKLVICGLTGTTNFPDVDDPDILDVSGFDATAAEVINKFITDSF